MKNTYPFLIIGFAAGTALAFSVPRPTTVCIPMATQGAQPLCISNRSLSPARILNGPALKPNQMVRAAVSTDFDWSFTIPESSTDRNDVDCFVVAK